MLKLQKTSEKGKRKHSYQRLAHKDSAPQGVCFVGLYTIELITVNCKHPLMNEPIRVSTASARF